MKEKIEEIEEFIRESAPNGVVIGISGGLDSAVVYALCRKALKGVQVLPVYLPYGDGDKEHAELLMEQYGDTLHIHDIKPAVDMLNLTGTAGKLVLGNIMARVRMTCLYTYANLYNRRVVGTTNKSEYMTGYFTKYGDGACDFEPILHLYKTEVIKVAKLLKIPQAIIDKVPSADLWEGQTDEGEMGISYKTLDFTLEHDCGVDSDMKRVKELVDKSDHKRHMPESLWEE